MNIYLLELKGPTYIDRNEVARVVVAAPNEEEARQMAAVEYADIYREAWLSETATVEILVNGTYDVRMPIRGAKCQLIGKAADIIKAETIIVSDQYGGFGDAKHLLPSAATAA